MVVVAEEDEDAKQTDATQKPLTKKEKQALKEKELNELDNLLSEFGVDASVSRPNSEQDEAPRPPVHDVDEEAVETPAGEGKGKKKRKVKKKKAEIVDGSEDAQTAEFGPPIVKDVAAVLKAKTVTKEKTPAEVAADKAAKEAKAKKQTEKKKTRKKKDKYAHGAPTR